jgi:hypothetical protein
MPRWAVLLIVAAVLGVLAGVLPLPGIVGTLVYAAAAICGVVGLILLLLDVLPLGGPRDRDRPLR